MGTGIVICGLNGAGKSTLGKALAKRLNFYFIDNEALYFPKTDTDYCYASARTREEASRILFEEIGAHRDFVFSCVKGDYGEKIRPFIRQAIVLDAPKDVRMQRVRDRSFEKFGERMLPGGDLNEREGAFFDLVQSRTEDMVETWLRTLNCPVLRVDGTRTVEENVRLIVERLRT